MTLPHWVGDSSNVVWEVLKTDDDPTILRIRKKDKMSQETTLLLGPHTNGDTLELDTRLSNEFDLRRHLQDDWSLTPVKLNRQPKAITLELSGPHADPLDQSIGQPFQIKEFLETSLALATAVSKMHDAGILHKDIKPTNVFLAPTRDHAWLTGFGIASRVPRERLTPGPAEIVSGTFAYMAPEQTGRINRSIDIRSDLYSVGVTLYQLATGVLPFEASTPIELIHFHIARKPVPPSERSPKVPAVLSAIIMKLLAKSPDERYRSASGLSDDLKRCLQQYNEHNAIGSFVLGELDTSSKLQFREKLYGREEDIARLVNSSEQVCSNGKPNTILVSGYSGIGKSSIVGELHQSLTLHGGIFATGKFDQYKRGIPYATLAQAFQGLVSQIVSQNGNEMGKWRTQIQEALGNNSGLIVNLVPELEQLVGPQTQPSGDLSGPEAQNRLKQTLVQFISAFARPEHPLILFIDDLQWIDASTLDVFEALVGSNIQHLLLIGAYRDNEVGPKHPLRYRIKAILESGANVEQIMLHGLREADINQLIADTLQSPPDRTRLLAELVHEKTQGNPFFATQFISALVDEGLLSHTSQTRWEWDISRIRARNITANVVELMLERLQRLPIASQNALHILACLGNTVSISIFQRALARSKRDTEQVLYEALSGGLIVQGDNQYAFAHDRVHEAAYSLFPLDTKARTHWTLGTRLLSVLEPNEIESDLFDIANQFNRSQLLEAPLEERLSAASLNLRAGRKARAAAAYSVACRYFESGTAQLQGHQDRNYELAVSLGLERLECTFLSGDIAATETMVAAMQTQSLSASDRAAVFRVEVQLRVVQSDNAGAMQSALKGLALLGVSLPDDPTWPDVEDEYRSIWENLQGKTFERLDTLSPMTDVNSIAAMRLLAEMQPPAYFSNFNMTIIVICRMINITLTKGITSTSSQALVLLGYVMGPAFGRYGEGFQTAKLAASLASKHNSPLDLARVKHLTGLAAAWTEPLPEALAWLRSAFDEGVEAGDLYYACFEAAVIVLHVFLSGKELQEVSRECDHALDFARETGFKAGADLITATERAVAALQGRTQSLTNYSDASFDETAFEIDLDQSQNTVVLWWYFTRKMLVYVLAEQYERTLEMASKVRSRPWLKNMQIEQMDCAFLSAIALAALIPGASEDARDDLWIDLRGCHDELKTWSDTTGSITFKDRELLVAAEIARLQEQDFQAQSLYEQSIQQARANGFLQGEALGLETAARYFKARGFQRIADTYLRDAANAYRAWGAHAKVRLMEASYPSIAAPKSGPTNRSTMIAQAEHFDLETVIKVAQTVSGEIVLERLVDALMRLAIEHAGATRVVLVLSRGSGHVLEAEALITAEGVVVNQRDQSEQSITLPSAIVERVLSTEETLLIDDAANIGVPSEFDEGQNTIRSLLALPLLSQGNVLGLLYLENHLAPNVFTPGKLSILKLIASHAAIALENTRLYEDLEERERRIRRLVDANIIGVFMWSLDGQISEANDLFLKMTGYTQTDLREGSLRWTSMTPPEDAEMDVAIVTEMRSTGLVQPFERDFIRKDGTRFPIMIGGATFGGDRELGVSFVLDLTERRLAERAARESERKYRELQSELAHANRVSTIGQLSAAISHEVRQPLVGVVSSASAGLNWLEIDPPNILAARRALERAVSEGHRAAEVLERTRALVKKLPPKRDRIDINEILTQTIALIQAEATQKLVTTKSILAHDLPSVLADRVQIQQVVLNLAINAIDAMSTVDGSARELLITSSKTDDDAILITVGDTGPGISEDEIGQVFEAFYSTKSNGMGMGLAISKTIVESYGGRLWCDSSGHAGSVFTFALPTASGDIAE